MLVDRAMEGAGFGLELEVDIGEQVLFRYPVRRRQSDIWIGWRAAVPMALGV